MGRKWRENVESVSFSENILTVFLSKPLAIYKSIVYNNIIILYTKRYGADTRYQLDRWESYGIFTYTRPAP